MSEVNFDPIKYVALNKVVVRAFGEETPGDLPGAPAARSLR